MHPEWDFFIYNSEVYINNSQNILGTRMVTSGPLIGKIVPVPGMGTFKNVPAGYLNLYEYNINRWPVNSSNTIYPYVESNLNYKTRFRKDLNNLVNTRKSASATWDAAVSSGKISSTYKMSASITRQALEADFSTKTNMNHTSSVIRNTCLNYQTINSSFSDTIVSGGVTSPLDDIFTGKAINMINIPSIFYGSSIKKGTVNLNYYVTGTLVATAKDENQNGQLYCTFGTSSVSGSVVGHVLYNEGIMFFPKAYSSVTTALASVPIKHEGTGSSAVSSSWQFFGAGAADGITHDVTHASASYSINFEGTTYKNSMTMFCHANKGELNYSNNPTFKSIEQSASIVGFTTSSFSYSDRETDIKNIASSSFYKGEDEFRKVTYISKVGIYDENDNLLMTVDLARPYKKEEDDDLTFKIKYDLL